MLSILNFSETGQFYVVVIGEDPYFWDCYNPVNYQSKIFVCIYAQSRLFQECKHHNTLTYFETEISLSRQDCYQGTLNIIRKISFSNKDIQLLPTSLPQWIKPNVTLE